MREPCFRRVGNPKYVNCSNCKARPAGEWPSVSCLRRAGHRGKHSRPEEEAFGSRRFGVPMEAFS